MGQESAIRPGFHISNNPGFFIVEDETEKPVEVVQKPETTETEPATEIKEVVDPEQVQDPTTALPETRQRKPVKVFDEEGTVEKKEPKLPDLRKMIDQAEHKKIIKKIFNYIIGYFTDVISFLTFILY